MDEFRKEAKLWAGVLVCAIILCFGMTCTVAAYRIVGLALLTSGNAPLSVSAESQWLTEGGPIKVTITSNQQAGESMEAVLDRAKAAAMSVESKGQQ